MYLTVRPRLSFFPSHLFTTAFLLGAVLSLIGGVRPAQAVPEERALFPHSLRVMPQAEKTAAATGQAVDAKGTVEFQIALRMRHFAKLQTRLSRGERISEAEMQAKYFPLPADYHAIIEWAKSQGLTVLDKDAERLGVHLRGPVATVERVLATRYAHVTIEGKDYLAAQSMPSLPTRLAGPVLGINGLQPYQQMHPHSPNAADLPPYTISDILDAYTAQKLPNPATTGDDDKYLAGRDQTIAILTNTFPNDNDINAFWSDNKITRLGTVTKIQVDMTQTLPPATGEETLDVSWAGGIAPAADIRVYAVGGTTTDGSMNFDNVTKGLQAILTDVRSGQVIINQLSISAGTRERDISGDQVSTDSQYFASLAAKGVSTFVSSGDASMVEYPSSDPSVTAVGGTSLLINVDSHAFASETAWANSGGGTSTFFQQPAYQQAATTGTMRKVPDVALAADPNEGAYLVLTKTNADGTQGAQAATTMGGTSWSAATWAGFSALINETRSDYGLPPLGLLNPNIYPLIGTTNFRDIVVPPRTNPNAPLPPQYDTKTGIGVPVMANLVNALTIAGELTLTEFTPDTGTPGTQVTLSGTDLDLVTGVAFNGTTAPNFQAASGTQLVVTVPAGATTGPITLTSRTGETATSATNFTVLPVGSGTNNFFANAQAVGPAQTRLTGTNVGATKEPGEPDHAGNPGGASVWYRWNPPVDGTYTINTFGSSFDTLLAVYTGASVDALTEVASNDDQSSSVTSSVVFDATFGTTYYIAVDGAVQANGTAAQGTIILNLVEADDMPVITDFTPQSGSVGQSVRILGANFLTVTGVTFNGAAALFRTDSATQITAVVPDGATTGPITVTDAVNDSTASDGFFTVVPNPANDRFANAQPLTGAPVTVTGTNVGAFKEPAEPNHADNPGGDSVWFVWTAPTSGVYSFDTFGSSFDTLLAVYTGNNVAALTQVAANDDAGPLGTSNVTFVAVAGTVYHIAIDGFNGAAGNYTLNVRATSGTPAINSFTPMSGGAGVSVVLTGTGFLTVTSVKFNGTPAPAFQINSDTQITVTVPANATTGPITATGFSGTGASTTNFQINPVPSNDLFGNSALLAGGAPITVTGTNAGATKEAGEPNIIPTDPGGHSIWYTFTAPLSGDFVVTTAGSDFDTLLGVYTGSTLTNLTPVAANDDDPAGGVTSAVTFTATRGVTYRIVVDGAGGEAGSVVLSIFNAVLVQNLYTTNFEPAEGFSTKLPLVGQGGWLSVNNVTGGNAVVSNLIPNLGQQGLVGQTALAGGAAKLQAYRPFNYFSSGDFPVVNFTTTLKISNSTNGQNDRFAFTPGIAPTPDDNGDYFSVVFDNATLGVYYQFPGGSLVPTGVLFSHDVIYTLQISLNFLSGTWNATLNGTQLATDQPFADLGGLTRISADWTPANPATPGNNSMVFDQYTVSAPSASVPVITVQPMSQSVSLGQPVTLSVVATGTPTLLYQWYFEGQPINGANSATYTIPKANPSDAGRYFVIVFNDFGSAQSLDAFLVVSTPQVASTSTVQVQTQTSPIHAEGGPVGSFLLTRTGDTTGALVVNYAVHGTAVNGVDYQTLDGQVTFKPGRAKKRIKVYAIDRGIRDGSSIKVTVKVLAGNGYSVGVTSKAHVFIERP